MGVNNFLNGENPLYTSENSRTYEKEMNFHLMTKISQGLAIHALYIYCVPRFLLGPRDTNVVDMTFSS